LYTNSAKYLQTKSLRLVYNFADISKQTITGCLVVRTVNIYLIKFNILEDNLSFGATGHATGLTSDG
jgi:hypothetical protein